MYEWFYSPVDLAWFRENAFQDALQDAGLGHVTHLTRIEWAFVRSLLGKPRRFSTAFLDGQRARLNEYRAHVRALRQLQLTGHSSTTAMETELGVHGALPELHILAGARGLAQRLQKLSGVNRLVEQQKHAQDNHKT